MKKKRILYIVLILLVLIQFVRPTRNEGQADTPQDITHSVQVPAHVQTMLKASCYDCHSNHTVYPWYTNIQPVGWWLSSHVNDGKRHLNFSEFGQYDQKRMAHKLEETAEEVEEGHMPMPAYTLIHTDTKLSKAQVDELVNWAKSQQQAVLARK